jgi:hypothetical protein
MSPADPSICCPPFDPEPWTDKTVVWDAKPFLKDRVTSLFHIPLNFGKVMIRCMTAIDAAGAAAEEPIVLSKEDSPWGSDVFIAVAKEVPGAAMTAISGTFLTRVYEGPFRNLGQWIAEMKTWVEGQGKTVRELYFYYTTCPKCARKYGKNYVVILARV